MRSLSDLPPSGPDSDPPSPRPPDLELQIAALHHTGPGMHKFRELVRASSTRPSVRVRRAARAAFIPAGVAPGKPVYAPALRAGPPAIATFGRSACRTVAGRDPRHASCNDESLACGSNFICARPRACTGTIGTCRVSPGAFRPQQRRRLAQALRMVRAVRHRVRLVALTPWLVARHRPHDIPKA